MANARHIMWHRAGPAAIAISALLVAASGCDGNGSTTTTTSSSGSTSTTGTAGAGGGTGGTGATGGTGGTGGAKGDLHLDPVADAHGALDSTPNSTGNAIFYTAIKNGEPGIFKVDIKADGSGGTVTELFVNDPEKGTEPLVAPFGISIDSADKTLFIADAGYRNNEDPDMPSIGAILTLGTSPGTPAVAMGTEGYKPKGVEVYPSGGEDTLYFTGVDPVSGEAGLFSRSAGGGAVTKVAAGAPFVNPSGVAVGKDQTFVTDALADDGHYAALILIEKGAASVFLDKIGVGYPAGVALSADEKTVYVSGVDPDTGTDHVLVIDIATKMATPFIGQGLLENTDAGGLHRARKADVFSWADLTAGLSGGAVYRISFK